MEVSELVRTLLTKRGITDEETIAKFLQPDFVRDTHDPMALQEMDRAIGRILSAMQHKEKITLYADFDCDGIPGAAVLYDTFAKIGYENIEVYIPHRDMEGYGFHTDAIEKLAKKGVSLIITIDVGTVAYEGASHAKQRGIDVIVTDHHEVKETLPDAFAIINPKLGNYPFRDLCGAAVAWKLASALLTEGRKRNLAAFTAIPEGWEKWLLDLVAIATIADMVPLVGENRTLAYFGLTVLRKTQRPGIRALCAQLRLRQSELTEDDISFSFAPRINAASRMGDPETAFQLLVAKNSRDAEKLVAHLEELNARRKGAVGSIVREAKKRVSMRFSSADQVIVLGDVEWKPALLGLVANSIVGERGGLVCMWGRNGKGELKGSCRSDGSISVVELFSRAALSFEEYGGHHGSGGFSVSHEAVHTLHDVLKNAAAQIEAATIQKRDEYDATVALSEISFPLFRDVSRLAPFGLGNLKPIFRIPRASIGSVRSFGKEKNHVEVTLSCFATGVTARAFDFFRLPSDFAFAPQPGQESDVLATLVHDTFRGQNSLALRLVDITRVT
ncbi:MAG: single-stranded-DNA-specific exonuclease RecJ [Parcubacteria group bacterium Gr01-1014_8]|nr:MAG: single-stranded-DNA-specific exonuclease RecJ [Parcubacteria group bacterium Gr01-1014_8]